jgi:hypothetical protein
MDATIHAIQALLKQVGREVSFNDLLTYLVAKDIYPLTDDEQKLAALAWLIDNKPPCSTHNALT